MAGRLEIPVLGQPFHLTARADRIDVLTDGAAAILDYKTGKPPTKAQVASLLAPQLPLEAAMLADGAFGAGFSGRRIADLTYLHLSGTKDGGASQPVAIDPPSGEDQTPADLAAAALERLTRLIALYRDPATSYPSRPRIMFERQTSGDYDHLARVKEWAAGPEGEE